MVDSLLRKIGLWIIIAGVVIGVLIGTLTRLPKQLAFMIPVVALMTGINIYRMPRLPKDYYTRKFKSEPPKMGDKHSAPIPDVEEPAIDAERLRVDIEASKKKLTKPDDGR